MNKKMIFLFFFRCLHYFSSSKKLEAHAVDCGQMNDCTIKLPSEDDKWLSFKNHCRKERMPFIIYADLECILEKTEMEETSSHKFQYHRVFSLAYYVHCSYDDSLSFYRFRRDKDCVAWFTEELRVLAHNVKSILFSNISTEFMRDNLEKFNNATHCHVCEKPFVPDDTRSLPFDPAIQRFNAFKL